MSIIERLQVLDRSYHLVVTLVLFLKVCQNLFHFTLVCRFVCSQCSQLVFFILIKFNLKLSFQDYDGVLLLSYQG